MRPLPTKLHQLLGEAIRDLKRFSRGKTHVVDMQQWHSHWENGQCHACLGGTWLHYLNGRFKDANITTKAINRLPKGIRTRLLALDSLRLGDVHSAGNYMGLQCDLSLNTRATPWEVNPTAWIKDMEELTKTLKTADI